MSGTFTLTFPGYSKDEELKGVFTGEVSRARKLWSRKQLFCVVFAGTDVGWILVFEEIR
jgi:hypothetical protein